MLYQIKENFWTLGNTFAITDRDGKTCFEVRGTAFSWGDKLSFQDPSGQELAYISQRLMSLRPIYDISVNGMPFAQITKDYSWFNKRFVLDIPGPNDYMIDGSFLLHDYIFTRYEKTVATVSKRLGEWTDCYGVEIVDDEDDISILCACIVIDQVVSR